MRNTACVEESRHWLAGVDQVRRYIAGAVLRDQRMYGPLPFKVGPDDAVQEVFVELIAGGGPDPLAKVRKDHVAAAVKRVLRRYRDRQYQRRTNGLPDIGDLDFEPAEDNSADVARLAAELQEDLGPTLNDEEAVVWRKLVTEGSKTVREIGVELGIRHQRVSEIRVKLETLLTDYLLSHE